MMLTHPLSTSRLVLEPLSTADSKFILALVNTEGWLKFIGDRKIYSESDASQYIQKINNDPNTIYWVVKLKVTEVPIGVITCIKRAYLEYADIGFAFLPAFHGQGYAQEASRIVLDYLVNMRGHRRIMAISIPDNASSLNLGRTLGFSFENTLVVDNETLQAWTISWDKIQIDQVCRSFFTVFTNKDDATPDWSLLHSLCLPEVIFTVRNGDNYQVSTLSSFIEPRQKILSDGTFTAFEECERNEQTNIAGNIAQRYSAYEKSGITQGRPFHQRGHKFFQFVKTSAGWKIVSVVWEDEVNA